MRRQFEAPLVVSRAKKDWTYPLSAIFNTQMDRSGKLSLAQQYGLVVILVAWFALSLLGTGRYVVADYSPIPVPQLGFSLASLISNADMSWLHGRMYLPLVMSAICYLGVWCILARVAYRSDLVKSPTREVMLLLAGSMMAWKGCSSELATPRALSVTLMQFLAMLSLILFASKRYLSAALSFICMWLCGVHLHLEIRRFSLLECAGSVIMATCFVLAWRRGVMRSSVGIVIFGGYLFGTIASLLVRTDPQWESVTIPTVNWALLSMCLVWLADSLKAAVIVICAAGFCIWSTGETWFKSTREDAQNSQVKAIMVRNNLGLADPAVMVLYAKRKSVFSHGVDRWIGSNLQSLYPQRTPVVGKVTSVERVPGGLQIEGWSDTDSLTTDHDVLFVDPQGKIAGFGRRPTAGMPSKLSRWDTPDSLSFIGFIPNAKPSEHYSVYMGTRRGVEWHPLEGSVTVP